MTDAASPDQSTRYSIKREVFTEVDLGAPIMVDWYCIFSNGQPLVVWDSLRNHWIDFNTLKHRPEYDHLDPRKVESGEQEVTVVGEDSGT